MIEVSYSEARGHLAELLDRVSNDREVVRIRRQGAKPSAVLIDADEYASLEETAHLLSSPANVRHLLQALFELQAGQGVEYESVDDLWRDIESARAGGSETQIATVDVMAALRESIERAPLAAVQGLESGEPSASERRRSSEPAGQGRPAPRRTVARDARTGRFRAERTSGT